MRRQLFVLFAIVPCIAVVSAAFADDPPAGGGSSTSSPRANAPSERYLAGSVQLDYLANPRGTAQLDQGLRGATAELTLKLTMDFNEHVSSNVKVCFACHGFELAMAFFDLRVADELNVRVGRFTPAFGSFPLRSDPANHNTSDKPLPYDMGRMIRLREWNEGVLPTPWVDTGIEVNGTHFFGRVTQLDYAVYAIGGPKGDGDGFDFDFKQSRSPERYYVDNNVEPTLGGKLALTLDVSASTVLTLGASVMLGHYDPIAKLGFGIIGAEAALHTGNAFLRSEYLIRRTQIAIGDEPMTRFKYSAGSGGSFADYTLKDGFVAELQYPVGRFDLIGRWDGLRRWGNVPATSPLRSKSIVLRYTAAVAYRLTGALRLKTSAELYDFSDFDDELVFHLGIAGPF